MHIIGVTGQIGHGKSTFSELLGDCATSARHYESGQLVMDVANAWQKATTTPPDPTHESLNNWIKLLPPILGQILHAEADEALLQFTAADEAQDPAMFEKLYQYAELAKAQPQVLRKDITLADKELYRPLMQWLGGYLVKMINPGVWYDEILRRVQQDSNDELAIITGLRFPGDAERIMDAQGVVVQITRPDVAGRDETDPTERERTTIPCQVTIFNDGTVADLAKVAAQFYQDLVRGQAKPEYHATAATVATA